MNQNNHRRKMWFLVLFLGMRLGLSLTTRDFSFEKRSSYLKKVDLNEQGPFDDGVFNSFFTDYGF